jgi:phosphoribosylaminoimidazolecarboxamide formyltransferase/IMP cyclohydrolase
MVVVDPADYSRVIEQLGRPEGPSLQFKFELMQKAFAHTAQFDALIAQTLAGITCDGETFTRSALTHHGDVRQLRYGENPHQKAIWASGHGPAWRVKWETHQGKELSYTNLAGSGRRRTHRARVHRAGGRRDQAHEPLRHGDRRDDRRSLRARARRRSARRPLAASSVSIAKWTRRPAAALTSTFIEAVLAPSIAADARPILAKKQNMRVVTADFPAMASVPTMVGSGEHAHGTEMRTILGGTLHQEPDRVTEARKPWPPSVNSENQLPKPNRKPPTPKILRQQSVSSRSASPHPKSGPRSASRGASART